MSTAKIPFGIRLESKVLRQVEAMARQKNVSRNKLIQRAVKEFIDREQTTKKPQAA